MLEVGSVFDKKYTILREVGHGGMSTVYLALNERVNKTWAIKEVRKNGLTDDGTSSQSLQAEVNMLKQLDHPHIVKIVDVVELDDSFIIVMDYIEGRDLLSVLKDKGPIDPDLVVRWMKQLCDVMGYLHSQTPPIIYRDMKPANVMLKPDGNVVVIDFGTARTNKGGSDKDTVWLGTRAYASPEQFGGQGETDARSDIYTLGTTMYHLLTGYSPADTHFVIYPIGDLRPELKGSGVEQIVAKCCQPAREDRYQSAADLLYDLQNVDVIGAGQQEKDKKNLRRFLATSVVCIAGIVGMVGFSLARNSTIQHTYDSSLVKAQNMLKMEEGEQYYKDALTMQPSNPKGYETLLKHIENDAIFQETERQALERILSTKPVAQQGESCQEVFRLENPSAYDHFRFELGKEYFFHFGQNMASGRYQYAKQVLEDIRTSERLSENEKSQAEAFYLISKVATAELLGDESGETDSSGDWDASRKETWSDVYQQFNYLVGGSPEESELNCGGVGNVYALYRAAGSLILNHFRKFINAGVKWEQLKTLLETGKAYLEDHPGSGMNGTVWREARSVVNTSLTKIEEQLRREKKS